MGGLRKIGTWGFTETGADDDNSDAEQKGLLRFIKEEFSSVENVWLVKVTFISREPKGEIFWLLGNRLTSIHAILWTRKTLQQVQNHGNRYTELGLVKIETFRVINYWEVINMKGEED